MKKIVLVALMAVGLVVFMSCSKKDYEKSIVEKISTEIGSVTKTMIDDQPHLYIWGDVSLPYESKLKEIIDKELGMLPTKTTGGLASDETFTWETPDYTVLLEKSGKKVENEKVMLEVKLFYTTK